MNRKPIVLHTYSHDLTCAAIIKLDNGLYGIGRASVGEPYNGEIYQYFADAVEKLTSLNAEEAFMDRCVS